MGNWIDIAEQYIKTKTPEECEEHYFTFYYKNKSDNLPTDQDCIQKGKRTNGIVPVDSTKAESSETRLKAFHVTRQKEIAEEEEELQNRNQQVNGVLANQANLEKTDVGGIVHKSSQPS